MKHNARVAIVTGGSRGIGAAVAEKLAADGLVVHLTYRDAQASAQKVAARIQESGGCVRVHRADVSVEADVEDLVMNVTSEDGSVHVLVNNAGIIDDRLLAVTRTSQWENILRVNLTGPFLTSRAVLPSMLAQGWGRIINISSNSARIPGAGQTAYAASKGGIEALTRGLAAEVGHKGIRVNAVAPGRIRTEMTKDFTRMLGQDTPGDPWGTPEDVAELVVFLAGDQANYIQGQIMTVDGGRLINRRAAKRVRS